MRSNFNFEGFGIIGCLFGLAGLGFSIWQSMNMRDTTKKLDLTIDDVSRRTNVEVSDSIVEKAIERAVNRQVNRAADEAIDKVRNDIHDEITKRVRKEVDTQYNRIAEETSERVSQQVAEIDEYSFRDRLQKKAEELMLKRFEHDLDGLRTEYSRKLGSQVKTFTAIEDTLTNLVLGGKKQNDDGGIRLRLG